MKIKYFGHSCFLVDDLLFDPFISGNPLAKNVDIDKIKCKFICITHDHSDHILDVERIAKNNNAMIVAIQEVAIFFADKGFRTEGMNIGGNIFLDNWSIFMTPALHSSNLGVPAGFVVKKSGFCLYHAGDTSFFSDMKLIKEFNLDVAFLPIGDRYTMGPLQAKKSAELLCANWTIPMHFNTFPLIEQDPKIFKEMCSVPIKVLDVNEEFDLDK